jgi:hypothetical protein
MEEQERIRQRAYHIWEREGRPEGRHEQHWAQASREIAAEGGTSTAPGDSPTPTAPDHGGTTPGEAAAAAAAVNAPREAEVGPERAVAGGSGGRGQNGGRTAERPRGR